MKSVALSLLLAAILAGQVALWGIDSPLLLLAPAAVVLGIVASAGLLGELTWLSVVAGALSPLALTWLGSTSTTLAVGTMCALWMAPRLGLARDSTELWRMASASAVAVALAGLVTAHYVAAGPLYHFTACVFGGATLALATMMVPADTVMASSLRAAATLLDGTVADTLNQSADVHRKSRGMPSPPGTKDSDWRDLLRLAERRLMLRNGTRSDDADRERASLDQRIVALARSLVGKRPPDARGPELQPGRQESAASAPATGDAQGGPPVPEASAPEVVEATALSGEEPDSDATDSDPAADNEGRRARPLAETPAPPAEAAPR